MTVLKLYLSKIPVRLGAFLSPRQEWYQSYICEGDNLFIGIVSPHSRNIKVRACDKGKKTPACRGRALQVKKERQSRVEQAFSSPTLTVKHWFSLTWLCWSGSNLEPLDLHLINSSILHLGFKNCQSITKCPCVCTLARTDNWKVSILWR